MEVKKSVNNKVEPNRTNHNIYSLLRAYPKKRISMFREIQVNDRGFVLLNLSKRIKQDILSKITDAEIISLLHYIDPDDVTDILQILNSKRSKQVLEKLSENAREKVDFLLKFDPRTAAGMMNLDYIEIPKKSKFKEVSKRIRDHEERTGKIPTILVIEKGFLLGELPSHCLLLAKKEEKIDNYIKKISTISYDKKESDVISLFKKNRHKKIAVLDDDKSILGIIYSDDILNLIEKKLENNLYGFAGVSNEEDVFDSAFIKVKNRYKWLMLNLLTAFLAASVVSLFQKTISAFVLLAVYMPIVAGMGGNAGTQTLAVVVRGIALKEILPGTGKKIILNELFAGLINGLINGVLVSLIAIIWNKNYLLGLIVGFSMVINLVIAGIFGTTVPLIIKKLGKDPAISSTVFITTATDLCGFFIFLSLGKLVFGV